MKQINYRKHAIGKKKLGKGLRGYKGGTGIPTGAFGGKSKFLKKGLDKSEQSVILEGMNETKVAVSEIADSIQDYLENCSKKDLIQLHNFIFSEQISDIEDVDWTK